MIVATTSGPRKVADLARYQNVYVQVLTGINVRISNMEQELREQGFGLDQGITLTSADGLVRLVWLGPLWIVGDGALVNVEIV